MSGHLNQEEITSCLAGAGDAAQLAHLRICGECAEKYAQVAGPMALFRESVKGLAEGGRSREVVVLRRPRRWRLGAALVAAAVLLSVGVPAYRQAERRAEGQRQAAMAAAEAQDDQLLRNVDAELSRSAPRSFERFEILMASDSAGSTGTK